MTALAGRREEENAIRGVCPETILLGAVCLLDLVVTVALVVAGLASEGNPLMAYFLERGLLAFCAAKLLLTIGPLAVAEWYRRTNERLVRTTLRAVTGAYLVGYLVGVAALNGGAF